jgi:Domain of unknown function (DUF4350)
MPQLSSGDRKVLIIVAAAFVVLVVVGLLLAPNNDESDVATTYSTASRGAKAAYLLLQELGYNVERWQRPIRDVKPDAHTVVIMADPPMVADEKAKQTVRQFVSDGGHLITTGVIGASVLPEDHSEFNTVPHTPWSDFDALTPSAITRAAPKLTLAPAARWSQSSGLPLFGNENDVVAVKMTYGKGDVIWLASATPFTNAGITQTNNLEFVLAAVGDREKTRVFFDEYIHGYGEHTSPERNHPIMIALLVQSAVLALAAIFTFSRRSGPLRPLAVEPRLAPLEFVETLGGLYLQAKAASVAVDVAYQRFQYWITRRLGLSPNSSPDELARAVQERWKLSDDNFAETLRDAASARYRLDLPQKEGLAIVRSLYSFAVKLKLFQFTKERT